MAIYCIFRVRNHLSSSVTVYHINCLLYAIKHNIIILGIIGKICEYSSSNNAQVYENNGTTTIYGEYITL